MVISTADVASLYSKIDHQGAIKAVKWALKKNTNMSKWEEEGVLYDPDPRLILYRCFIYRFWVACKSSWFYIESELRLGI